MLPFHAVVATGARVHTANDLGVIEFRRYRLDPGRREEFIELFADEFVHTQEADGIAVLGFFRCVDEPDRFVWIRAFPDLESRVESLTSFYSGGAWGEHGPLANDIMTEWDDVHLLRPGATSPPFWRAYQPHPDGPPEPRRGPRPELVAAIYPGATDGDALPPELRSHVAAVARRHGDTLVATFVTDPGPNDFPRLPVHDHEVGIALIAVETDPVATQRALDDLRPGATVLRLDPDPASYLPGVV